MISLVPRSCTIAETIAVRRTPKRLEKVSEVVPHPRWCPKLTLNVSRMWNSGNPSTPYNKSGYDWTLHSHDIPADFVYCYYLPLVVERLDHLLSVSFEGLSHSGESLVSSRKYSVAWVFRGIITLEQKAVEDSNSWFRNGQTRQNLPVKEDGCHFKPQIRETTLHRDF